MTIEFAGRTIAADAQGYLRRAEDWDEALAEELAHRDGITLTQGHWDVLRFLREYYAAYRTAPPMRLLVKEIGTRFGMDKGNSRYLYRLFPEGPARQASRYAGLPKPVSCI